MRTRVVLLVSAILLLMTAAQAQGAPAGFTKLTTTSATAVSYTDSTCLNQTTCYYFVTAVDAAGHESPGALCSGTQTCFGTNQAVATMPNSGTHTVVVGWTASPSTVTGYNVYRAVGPLAAGNVTATVN